jgi:hypothetical protein
MRGESVESLSFDFGYAQNLKDEAIAAFKRALIGHNVGLGEPTFIVNQRPGKHDFLIVLEHPTPIMPMIDSLLNVVATHCGYTMQITMRPLEEIEESARRVVGAAEAAAQGEQPRQAEARPREERGSAKDDPAGRGRPAWRNDPQD